MALMASVACTNDQSVDFATDRREIKVGANGGVEKVKISSNDAWVATVGMQEDGTPNPWITVSPANGRGSVTCDIQIDSALTTLRMWRISSLSLTAAASFASTKILSAPRTIRRVPFFCRTT